MEIKDTKDKTGGMKMSQPTLNEAKELAKKHKKEWIIILHSDGETLGYASYGQDKQTCIFAKQLADVAYDAIEENYGFVGNILQ